MLPAVAGSAGDWPGSRRVSAEGTTVVERGGEWGRSTSDAVRQRPVAYTEAQASCRHENSPAGLLDTIALSRLEDELERVE